MKASDFRIGNYVNTCIPGMEIMIPVLETKVQGVTIFNELMFCYQPMDSSGFNMPACHVTGIPINEEWLRRSGFILLRKKVSLNVGGELFEYAEKKCSYGYFIIWYAKELGWTLNSVLRKESYYIKYVHQLQNLYFALTGEELTIKT